MHPAGLVEIFKAFHGFHIAVNFGHVVFKLTAFTGASTAIVKIGLAVIVNKNAGIYHSLKSFNITLNSEAACRAFAGSYANFPGGVPFGAAWMGEIEIISAVFVSAIGCPHKASFRAAP